jgi:hypothetical protein
MRYAFTEEEREAIKQKIESCVEIVDECWEWKLFVSREGWGSIRYKCKDYAAHCLSYSVYHCATPEEMARLVVRHKCHSRSCVNPDHLEAGARPMKAATENVRYAFTEEARVKVQEYITVHKQIVGDCWEWKLCIDQNGYGRAKYMNRSYRAHCLSYVAFHGATPEQMKGKLVRHQCHNRKCVNPDHLEIGTPKDNAQDMRKAGRQSALCKPSVHLNDTIVREIILSRLSLSMLERVEKFGVKKGVIWSIDAGRTWTHVSREGVPPYDAKKRPKRPFEWNAETFSKAFDKIKKTCEYVHGPNKFTGTPCLLPLSGVYLNKGYLMVNILSKKISGALLACQYKEQRTRREGEVVRHLCGVGSCCNPEHLAFGTQKENCLDTIRMDSNPCVKLSLEKASQIREKHKNGMSIRALAKEYDVSRTNISNIVKRKTWIHDEESNKRLRVE